MEQLSRHASQDEQIAYLYSLIREDPDFLQFFDRKQFSDTPLHSAAGQGRTWLALEIQMLMPSFGRKLNPDGFSPVDLALRQGHCETAMAMIKLNPDLVRVHGREGITLLHWATEMAVDVDILAGFLLSCPDSINELTNRGESAVHMAVKNGNVAAFVVLLGWLKRKGRKDVLGWRDWEGNTVLHLATSTNQSQVLSLSIISCVMFLVYIHSIIFHFRILILIIKLTTITYYIQGKCYYMMLKFLATCYFIS